MTRSLLYVLVFFTLAIPMTCSATTQTQQVRSKIERYMGAAVKVDHFMGSILVARNGRILIAKGYGKSNLKHQIPNTAETEFRIASLTKSFTAASILMLQARGKLNVRDPVCKYIPTCPKAWKAITIYDLLTHTSGIPDFRWGPSYAKFSKNPTTPERLLTRIEKEPLAFKPGTKFRYSNPGYDVLGYVIQRESGETYKKFLQQHIFTPLGMKKSGYASSHPSGKDHAEGYVYSNGSYKPAKFINMTVPYSAGALYSSVGDLYTWDRALETGKLLPVPLLKEMFSPQVLMGGPDKMHYGFGWMITTEYGHKKIEHGGGINGFTSANSFFPGQHAYVIVLSNVSSNAVGGVANALTAYLFGKKYEVPPAHHPIHLSAKDLRKFVGKYETSSGSPITFTLNGDQLMTQAGGRAPTPMVPNSKTEFFLPHVSDVWIDFVINSQGNVTGLEAHFGGHKHWEKKVRGSSATND